MTGSCSTGVGLMLCWRQLPPSRHSDASQNLSMLIKWYFLVPTRKYRKEALDLLLRSLIKVTVSLEQVNSLTLKQHLLCYCETEH